MARESTIGRILAIPNGWIRVDEIATVGRALELGLSVQRGRRGPALARWTVQCLGVREQHLVDFNGGGLALYSSSHPAARQYVDRRGVLRLRDITEWRQVLGALLRAHVVAVDDWIPFHRYVTEDLWRAPDMQRVDLRGPAFLLRAYGTALRRLEVSTKLSIGTRAPSGPRPRVLHLGNSYVVANEFKVSEG